MVTYGCPMRLKDNKCDDTGDDCPGKQKCHYRVVFPYSKASMEKRAEERRQNQTGIERYRVGRRFEYRVRDALEADGFWTVRQARSAFPDLIGIKKGFPPRVVECKVNIHDLKKQEREDLLTLKDKLGCDAFVAHKVKGKIVFMEL